jgi:3-methyladenine DNA glycosylase AlkD
MRMATIPILDQLEALGTEQARKTYRRHGVTGPSFGVSYADLGKLRKKIKVDHALAQQLWASSNHDARILATMIADPQAADNALLDSWASNLDNYVVSDAFSTFAAQTPLAREKADQWTPSDAEWVGATGWNILAHLALDDDSLPDAYFERYIDIIQRDIHGRKNRARYSMNNALIAIGGRNDALEAKAIAAAGVIGKVKVDHGETNCKTPDAIPYIAKMKARTQEKEKA